MYLGTSDEIILAAAYEQALTLVTYDLRTIVPLAKSWAEDGRHHGGLIFVDVRSIAPNDFGGLVRALRSVVEEFGEVEWVDRVVYLTRYH